MTGNWGKVDSLREHALLRIKRWQGYRGVFMTLPNIYDGMFCKNI